MVTTLPLPLSRPVHEIRVKSKNGRLFTVDIHRNGNMQHDSTVIAFDPNKPNKGSWFYSVGCTTTSAANNFIESLKLILAYFEIYDPLDEITEINNPCNCPFLSEADQNNILSALNIKQCVSIN